MTGRLIARDRLDATQRRHMLACLHRCFDGVQPEQFDRDLQEKTHVILLETGHGVVGFSTLQLFPFDHDGERLTVVYSGDTIVTPEAWGTSALARTWIDSVHRLSDGCTGRLVWLLLSSGFRTYRFLPVFWREFWPRYDRPTPRDVLRLRQRLAQHRFGKQYDPADGVVRFERPQRLQGELVEAPPAKLADPHVAFFLASNPGHARGDELVCLADLGEANLTPAGRRMVRAGARRRARRTIVDGRIALVES